LRATIDKIKFSRFSFGSEPPELSQIRVFETSGPAGRGLEINIRFDFNADIDVEVEMNKMLRLGINKLGVGGDVCIRMEPLLEEEPVIGGIVIYFYDPPTVDFGFTGLGQFIQHPQITALTRSVIDQQIRQFLVLPNVIGVRIGTEEQGVDLAHLHRPAPIGVMRITALRATGLNAADWTFTGAGTSDPYLRIKLSDQEWKSEVVKKTCNPVWSKGNISHEFLVYSQDQKLTIDIYDWDLKTYLGRSDDHIGHAHSLPIHYAMRYNEQPIQVYDPDKPEQKAGELYLRFEWFEIGRKLKGTHQVLHEKLDLFVLEIKVDTVFMSVSLGHSVGLKAKFGERQIQTRKTDVRSECVEAALDGLRANIAKRCFKLDKTLDEIAYVTQAKKEDLEIVLGLDLDHDDWANTRRERTPDKSTAKSFREDLKQLFTPKRKVSKSQTSLGKEQADAKNPYELEYVLRFIAHRDQIQYEAAELTLFSEKAVLGKVDITQEKFDGQMRKTTFASNVQAEITVSMHSLHGGRLLERRQDHLSRGTFSNELETSASLRRSAFVEQPMTRTLKQQGLFCEWMNSALEKVWPYVSKTVEKIVRNQVTKEIDKVLGSLNVRFKDVTLGKVAPILGPISVSSADGKDTIEIQIGVNFDSEIEVSVTSSVVRIGIKSLAFHGQLCIRLMHLIPQIPIIGGIVIFFLDAPVIDYKFTETAKGLNLEYIKRTIGDIIRKVLVDEMVLPNVVSIPLGLEGQGVDRASMNRPAPICVLKVTAIRAKELKAADMNLFSQASSDPYLKVRLADQEWRSPIVKATLNPEWTTGVRSKYFLVYNKDQTMRIDIFDYDNFKSDDHIGFVEPLTLEDAKYWSEMEMDVFDPASKKKKEKKGAGTLTMRFESIPISLPGDPPTGHHVLLELKVDEVYMPAILGTGCKVVATFGKATRSTKMRSVDEPQVAANAVLKDLELIVKRSYEKNFTTSEMEQITELSPQEITKMLKNQRTKLDSKAEKHVKEQTKYMIELEYMLHFVAPIWQVKAPDAKIKLALINERDKEIGTAVMWLNEVTGDQQTINFKAQGGKEVKAELTVNLVGLLQDGVDDQTDIDPREKSVSRLLSCLAPCTRLCSS